MLSAFLAFQPLYVAFAMDISEETGMYTVTPNGHAPHFLYEEGSHDHGGIEEETNLLINAPAPASGAVEDEIFHISDEGVVVAENSATEALEEESGRYYVSGAEGGVQYGSTEITATQTSASAPEPVLTQEGDILSETTSAEKTHVSVDDLDCTPLADGALYCVPNEAATLADGVYTQSVVSSRPGANGNKEIFLVERERTVQITHSTYDNLLPMYDYTSGRIVWSALINDRLQIMLHDRHTGETRQLTDTSYNNSNPSLADDVLVWQAWMDGNWEIMLAHTPSRTPFVPVRITDNKAHDMFPRVFDGTVSWQSRTRDAWHVVVYDIATGRVSYVEKNRNGQYENPRFALLFDERDPETGEVTVMGYDVASRSEIPLSPVERPTPLPVTPLDETGDALPGVSTSSSLKTTREGEDGNDDETWGDTPRVPDETSDTGTLLTLP